MQLYSIYLIIIWGILIIIKPTRKITLAFTPWLIFACSYDWMRFLPNYEVNPIDIKGIYEAERNLFGISTPEGIVIPGQYFATHNNVWADFFAGIFYLCWVPVPLGYSMYLYIKGKKKEFARFSVAFLWINLLGFCLYYVHPAAPPWYVLKYGFDVHLNTPGNVAGLVRFDNLMPFPIFGNIYSENSNVFAAVPSLHSAYVLTAAIYAMINKSGKWTALIFFIISAGIWCTAVYSCHHYIIDVLLGILEAFTGILLLECVLLKIPTLKHNMEKYISKI